jgi:hypothetical protein
VNNTFQQLLRCFCCYDGSDWTTLLPQVEFPYNASRALGIEHTPFEANFGFSPKEPPDLLFCMRPSIPVSQDATERLKLLHEVHTLVRSVLQLHKDEMEERTEPSQRHTSLRETRCESSQQTFFSVDNRTGNLETTSLDLLQWSKLGNTVTS